MTRDEARVVQPAHQQTQQEIQQVQDVAGIAFLADGTGVPVLFLHGLGGAARQFTSQLRWFARQRRALAWDMPGHGGSAPLPLVTVDSLAAALGGFIAALGLDRPVLVGHGLAGMIVQRLLAEAPHVARAVVLAQTVAAFGDDAAAADTFIRARLGPVDEGRSMADLAGDLVARMAAVGADPAGLALAEDCIARTPASSYRDTVLAMRGFDLRDALRRLSVPVLVLSGARDPVVSAAAARRMAELIPNVRYVELEGAGQRAPGERPVQFNAAVGNFLAETAGG